MLHRTIFGGALVTSFLGIIVLALLAPPSSAVCSLDVADVPSSTSACGSKVPAALCFSSSESS